MSGGNASGTKPARLPPGWEWRRLKYVATYNDEVLPENTDDFEELRYVEISDVSLVGGVESTSSLYFHEAPSRARRRVKSGDVLISTVRTYLKAIAAVPLAEPNLVVSTGFCVVRPGEGMDPGYLGWIAKSEPFVEEIVARSVGVSYPAIKPSELATLDVVVPPFETQCRIARFLDEKITRIDALISKKRALLCRLAEKRQALITQAVTEGLDSPVALKDSGMGWLGKIPGHWETKPLRYVATIGNGSTPQRDDPDYWQDGSYPWLNSSVVNRTCVSEASDWVTACALKECHLPRIEPPAVLVGITGQGRTRGMASLLLFEATINQHLAYIKPYRDVSDAAYIRYVMTVAYTFLRNESDGGGSTKGAITCEQLAHMCIPVPPHDEQLAIAVHVDAECAQIDRLVEAVRTSLDRLTEYRAALITAAVTGQLDIASVAHRKEPAYA